MGRAGTTLGGGGRPRGVEGGQAPEVQGLCGMGWHEEFNPHPKTVTHAHLAAGGGSLLPRGARGHVCICDSVCAHSSHVSTRVSVAWAPGGHSAPLRCVAGARAGCAPVEAAPRTPCVMCIRYYLLSSFICTGSERQILHLREASATGVSHAHTRKVPQPGPEPASLLLLLLRGTPKTPETPRCIFYACISQAVRLRFEQAEPTRASASPSGQWV